MRARGDCSLIAHVRMKSVSCAWLVLLAQSMFEVVVMTIKKSSRGMYLMWLEVRNNDDPLV